MPTKREREYYRMGFKDGMEAKFPLYAQPTGRERIEQTGRGQLTYVDITKPKRKLSAWNKFVKANSKKPRFRLRSGSPNLKKLGVAFRKTQKRGGKR
jgi:hypothetical protein